jgi:hypothetical protein
MQIGVCCTCCSGAQLWLFGGEEYRAVYVEFAVGSENRDTVALLIAHPSSSQATDLDGRAKKRDHCHVVRHAAAELSPRLLASGCVQAFIRRQQGRSKGTKTATFRK